jgi:hypothetical protein
MMDTCRQNLGTAVENPNARSEPQNALVELSLKVVGQQSEMVPRVYNGNTRSVRSLPPKVILRRLKSYYQTPPRRQNWEVSEIRASVPNLFVAALERSPHVFLETLGR